MPHTLATLTLHILCTIALCTHAAIAQAGAIAFQQACLDATSDALVLNIAAHPDDEAARTMVVMRHRYGARTVTLYSTAGGGGQNAIGREIGPRLAGLRIRETLAAARHTGTEVRWLGFDDFGFSKSREETLALWGGEAEVKGRMERAVREIGPDVVFTNHGLQRGHGHHRASAWAIREVAAAMELPLFERVFTGATPFEGDAGIALTETIAIDPGVIDPVRGSNYAQQAYDGWLEHRSQGPWPERDPWAVEPDRWLPVGAVAKALGDDPAAALPSMFDVPGVVRQLAVQGVDAANLRARLDAFGADRTRAAHVGAARELLPLLRGLRDALAIDEPGRARVARRIGALEAIVAIGAGLSLDVRLVDERLSRGAKARVRIALRGREPLPSFVASCAGLPAVAGVDGVAECEFEVPHEPAAGDETARWTESIFVPILAHVTLGELTVPLTSSIEVDLGPALRVEWPREAMLIPSGTTFERVLSLDVEHFGDLTDATPLPIKFRAPAGIDVTAVPDTLELTTEQPRARVLVRLRGDGSNTQRFILLARVGDAAPARIEVQPLAAETIAALRIGLVRGPDDTLENAFHDLGIDHDVLDEAALATVDLARFTTVVLDIRAYHHRPDLAIHRDRLLAFQRRGGRLVAFYHKASEWNPGRGKPQLAPFDLEVGTARVAEEDAAVEFLAPEHPLLRRPFEIGAADFEGWVQERGLNFPTKWDPEWTPLLRMHDRGEKPLDGAMLIAEDGDGDFVYCSLALYRQLRIAHVGATRLLINLLTPQ